MTPGHWSKTWQNDLTHKVIYSTNDHNIAKNDLKYSADESQLVIVRMMRMSGDVMNTTYLLYLNENVKYV